MTLKTLFRAAAATVLGMLCLAVPLSAQTTLTTTTLSTALADTSGTVVSVASATGITAPGTGAALTYLYLDWELMSVRTVNGTTLTVQRGAGGTRSQTHAANTLIYVVPAVNGPLTTVDQGGSCTPANNTYLPIINTRNGNIWNCLPTTTGSIWQAWNSISIMETKPRVVVGGTGNVSGGANNVATGGNYTILPTDYLIVLNTTLTGTGSVATAIKSFTLPSHLGLAGKQIIIKDESGGLSATTFITLVGTIDGTHSATATVVALKTPFASVGLSAGSGGWFTIFCNTPLAPSGSGMCR